MSYRQLKNEDKESAVLANFNGSITKIWFPDGPPPYNPDTEAADRSA